ncbi:MAG: GIY-YIG nuclease family protein, partial [Candidatus Acidiferrales bacterium]
RNDCMLGWREFKMDKTFHVYILAGKSGVLYTGITNDLMRRVREHKQKKVPGFTQKYNITNLVWFEAHSMAKGAIAREKQIKGWSRVKKIALIEAMNPHWKDLTEELQSSSPPPLDS